MKWLDVFFSNYQWYRRWLGGYWARWYIDAPVCNDIWFNSLKPGQRPGLGRGTPTIEDYRSRP